MQLRLAVLLVSLGVAQVSFGQAPPTVPAGDKEPYLRLEAGGPTSAVTALGFSPDGRKLYAGGWDKVVRVWNLNAQGQFALDPNSIRVPIGPGNFGALNALAVSPDGRWLAVGGVGMFDGASGFRQAGRVGSTRIMTPTMLNQVGTIYVFDLQGQQVRLLQGHKGTISSLAFVPTHRDHPNKAPVLVSVAREQQGEKRFGAAAVWDMGKTEPLARIGDLPDPENRRPGIGAWHTGADALQVRVALAMEDGQLRLWDPSRKENALTAVREPGWVERQGAAQPVRFNNTAVALGGDRVLTGSEGRQVPPRQQQGTQLRVWTAAAGAPPRADANPLAFFASDPATGKFVRPQALCLASETADAKAPDLAAFVVARFQGEGPQRDRFTAQRHLALVNLNDGAVRVERSLWAGSEPLALVASAGRHVAVAGNTDHEILVFAIADLLQNRGEPQRLRSVGAAPRYASFVLRDKDLGLAISQTPKTGVGQSPRAPRQGDIFFDFARRRLFDDPAVWKLDTPALGNWRVQLAREKGDRGEQAVLTVFQGGAAAGPAIRLNPDTVVNDYALLPPVRPFNEPFLAVAATELGYQLLNLYRVQTGDQVRQYSGHEGRIISVAFSSDGRLLVSTAEDLTVRVWSLTDLDQILGKRGLVRGLQLKTENQAAVVESTGSTIFKGDLKPGETVLGLVENDQLRPTASAQEFHDVIDRIKPGTEVKVRVRDQNGAQRVAALRVGQRIDDQKPLLSLFITAADNVLGREWLGWNPLGPYEASAQKAERNLGWHINTGDVKNPARFTEANVYRKQYYREGILKELIAAGDITKVPPPPAPPPPRMGMFIHDGDKLADFDAKEQVLVRQPKVTLKLEATGDYLDIVKDVAWQLDDAPEKKLEAKPGAALKWSETLEVPRGVHRVRFHIRTNESQPRSFVQELLVRYQPPAPLLTPLAKQAQAPVREANYELAFDVAPGLASEEVGVQVRLNHKNVFDEAKTFKDKQAVKQALTLAPGYNQIEVMAFNRAAPAELRDVETRRFALEIMFTEKAQPPRIALQSVALPGAAGGPEQSVPIAQLLQPVVVHVPKVRVVGSIKASEKLSKAEYKLGDAGKPMPLSGFDPQKPDVLVQQDVSLKPGRQEVQFLAQTESSVEAKSAVILDYQPTAPTLVIVEPRPDQVFRGAQDQGSSTLRCEMQLPADRQPFTAHVWLNGKELPQPPQINEQDKTLTAPLTLRPGGNTVQVLLNNEWGGRFTSEKVEVSYRRPPKIEKLEKAAGTKAAFVDLTAHVWSPLRLLRESVEVQVNGNRRRVSAVEFPEKPTEGNVWVIRVKDVALDADSADNKIAFRVGNTEAACEEPATVEVVRAVVKPPVLEFVEPQNKSNIADPEVTVRLHVDSEKPLESLKLIQEGQPPRDIDVKKLTKGPGGTLELEEKQTVKLAQGPNQLRLEALYEGGEHRSPTFIINYVPRRTEFVIDSLELIAAGQPSRISSAAAKAPAFSPVGPGRVTLRGRVRWGDEVEAAKRKLWQQVRIAINGFQQPPATLNLINNNESEFTATVLLNRADNVLRLSVNEQDAGEFKEFSAKCDKPVEIKRLHMVLLSLTDENEANLQARFLKAFNASAPKEGLPQSDAFERIYPYRPLTKQQVRPESINGLLGHVSDSVKSTAGAGDFANDVVVLYYQGGELVNEQGNTYQTDLSRARPNSTANAISCDRFVEFFADTPGAHLLLLDVDRKLDRGPDRLSDWQDNFPIARAHVALLRSWWLGSQAAPFEAHLLYALEQILPKSPRLQQVTEGTSKYVGGLGQKLLKYIDYLPPYLGDMRLAK